MTIMGTIAASMSAFLVCAAEFDPVAFIEDALARGEKTVGGCRVPVGSFCRCVETYKFSILIL